MIISSVNTNITTVTSLKLVDLAFFKLKISCYTKNNYIFHYYVTIFNNERNLCTSCCNWHNCFVRKHLLQLYMRNFIQIDLLWKTGNCGFSLSPGRFTSSITVNIDPKPAVGKILRAAKSTFYVKIQYFVTKIQSYFFDDQETQFHI